MYMYVHNNMYVYIYMYTCSYLQGGQVNSLYSTIPTPTNHAIRMSRDEVCYLDNILRPALAQDTPAPETMRVAAKLRHLGRRGRIARVHHHLVVIILRGAPGVELQVEISGPRK